MERYIGMDVHAASCTLAVIFEKGRKLKDFPVETNGQALVEAVQTIPGHKQQGRSTVQRCYFDTSLRVRITPLK